MSSKFSIIGTLIIMSIVIIMISRINIAVMYASIIIGIILLSLLLLFVIRKAYRYYKRHHISYRPDDRNRYKTLRYSTPQDIYDNNGKPRRSKYI